MARILTETELCPEAAMDLFCWHELVEQMEKQDHNSLHRAISEVCENHYDWELEVLKKYTEFSETDLII